MASNSAINSLSPGVLAAEPAEGEGRDRCTAPVARRGGTARAMPLDRTRGAALDAPGCSERDSGVAEEATEAESLDCCEGLRPPAGALERRGRICFWRVSAVLWSVAAVVRFGALGLLRLPLLSVFVVPLPVAALREGVGSFGVDRSIGSAGEAVGALRPARIGEACLAGVTLAVGAVAVAAALGTLLPVRGCLPPFLPCGTTGVSKLLSLAMMSATVDNPDCLICSSEARTGEAGDSPPRPMVLPRPFFLLSGGEKVMGEGKALAALVPPPAGPAVSRQLTSFKCPAYRRVFRVCSHAEEGGDTVAIMMVRASFPTKQSLKMCVSLLARKGMCDDFASIARMHSCDQGAAPQGVNHLPRC